MTLKQEAYKKIDQLTDDGLKILIDMIDKIKVMSISDFKETGSDIVGVEVELAKQKDVDLFPIRSIAFFSEEDVRTKMIRAEKKKKFLTSAGKCTSMKRL